MRHGFSRISLLWKILLSTSVAVTILFAITTEIVLANINRTMSDSLKEEVRGSFKAYTSLWRSRQELLAKVSQIISEMQDVRAAMSTRDKLTIQDTAGELWSKISKLDAIFLVTEPNGKVVASLGGVTSPELSRNLDIASTAAARFPSHIENAAAAAGHQVSGFFLQDTDPCALFQISVTPVYLDSLQGLNLRYLLVAGYRVDALVAKELKDATNSDFLFLTPNAVIASTLNPRASETARARLAAAQPNELVSDGVHKYAWFRTPLQDISGVKVADI
jgi:hypothetical protein